MDIMIFPSFFEGLSVTLVEAQAAGVRCIISDTINPANQTGIGDRVGSLEIGKDGDVVIWQNDPLNVIGARAYVTVIDGKVVYRADTI